MFAAELRSIAVGRQAVSELALLALGSVAENLLFYSRRISNLAGDQSNQY